MGVGSVLEIPQSDDMPSLSFVRVFRFQGNG